MGRARGIGRDVCWLARFEFKAGNLSPPPDLFGSILRAFSWTSSVLFSTWAYNLIRFVSSEGVRSMPDSEQSSSNTNDPEVAKVVKLASDRMAVERACRFIDDCIAEMWPSPTLTPPDRPEAA